MTNQKRIEEIRARLQQAFTPTQLDVIDESHKHVGHPGAQSGAGHFALVISSPMFNDKSQIDCHRMIYQSLEDFMKTEIHALKIKVI